MGLRAQHAPSDGTYGARLTAGGSAEAGMSTANSRAASAVPQIQNLKVTDYLVGPQLEAALAAGQDIVVSWPFADGEVKDFMQAEALWYVYRMALINLLSPASSCCSRLSWR